MISNPVFEAIEAEEDEYEDNSIDDEGNITTQQLFKACLTDTTIICYGAKKPLDSRLELNGKSIIRYLFAISKLSV